MSWKTLFIIAIFIFLIALVVDFATDSYIIPNFFIYTVWPALTGAFTQLSIMIYQNPQWGAIIAIPSLIFGIITFWIFSRMEFKALRWGKSKLDKTSGYQYAVTPTAPQTITKAQEPAIVVQQPAMPVVQTVPATSTPTTVVQEKKEEA